MRRDAGESGEPVDAVLGGAGCGEEPQPAPPSTANPAAAPAILKNCARSIPSATDSFDPVGLWFRAEVYSKRAAPVPASQPRRAGATPDAASPSGSLI